MLGNFAMGRKCQLLVSGHTNLADLDCKNMIKLVLFINPALFKMKIWKELNVGG